MKGILLAGGSGTRLYPATFAISKQLIPIYDKPMVYYPLSVLMLAGIKDILLISTPHDIPIFRNLLNDGSKWGLNISYAIQEEPNGIAEAFIISEEFIGKEKVCLILGDNIFYGNELSKNLLDASKNNGATIFVSRVRDPERYGIVEFDNNGEVKEIIEKPQKPLSNYAITGLYFYDNSVVKIAKGLKKSSRGELEITDINKIYLSQNLLSVFKFGRGQAWLDTGTHDSLLEASQFVATLEHRQGLKIACLEEIAFNCGYIRFDQLKQSIKDFPNNSYGKYLKNLIKEKRLEKNPYVN